MIGSRTTAQGYEAAPWSLLALAAASALAGAGHLSLVGEHLGESVGLGIGFAVLGLAQVALAAALVWRPRRAVLVLTLAVFVVSVAAWAVSRTVGLPFGPDAAQPEPIGFADVAVKLVEVAGVGLTVRLIGRGELGTWRGRAIPMLTAALLGGNAVAVHNLASAHALEALAFAAAGAVFGVAVARTGLSSSRS